MIMRVVNMSRDRTEQNRIETASPENNASPKNNSILARGERAYFVQKGSVGGVR